VRDIPSPCLEEAQQIFRGHVLGSKLDSGFDGGEFSGPAHDRMLEDELHELANRYDVDYDELVSVTHVRMMSNDEMAGYGDSQ